MGWRTFDECRFVGFGPDFLNARAAIQPTAALAWVGGDQPAIEAPRQDASQHSPRIVGLPTPVGCDLVAPCREDTACAPVGEGGQREVAEGMRLINAT